jgi:hypothetical protein
MGNEFVDPQKRSGPNQHQPSAEAKQHKDYGAEAFMRPMQPTPIRRSPEEQTIAYLSGPHKTLDCSTLQAIQSPDHRKPRPSKL